jgi:hypothetical protein
LDLASEEFLFELDSAEGRLAISHTIVYKSETTLYIISLFKDIVTYRT